MRISARYWPNADGAEPCRRMFHWIPSISRNSKIPSCRDPRNLPFLQLAAHARADFLVTGDRDLLDIRDRMRFAIVTAEAFMSKLEKLERNEL
jgi:predicted nucleic acid-binding protein